MIGRLWRDINQENYWWPITALDLVDRANHICGDDMSNNSINRLSEIIVMCLRKTWALKSHDYRDDIEKLRLQSLQNVFRPH